MERNLKQTAELFGITRPKLIKLMREKYLLNEQNLPTHPYRDRDYLRIKNGSWYHEAAGMQYCQSVRIKGPGIQWLAEKLGLECPPVPAERRDVA